MNDTAEQVRPDSDATAAPAASPRREKATGWKVPLLFCAALLGLIGLVALLRGGPPPLPDVPAPLLEQAQSMSIKLTGAEGEHWHNRITSDATGLEPQVNKNAKLRNLTAQALDAGRQDAACMAAVLVTDPTLRDAAFRQIFDHALAECDRLVWGVFAIRGASPEVAARWAPELNERWTACTGSKK